jgi:hypothetical protein
MRCGFTVHAALAQAGFSWIGPARREDGAGCLPERIIMSDFPAESAISADASPSPASRKEAHLSCWRWIVEGWRCAFLLKPLTDGARPTPFQFAVLFLVYELLSIGLERLLVEGSAEFLWRYWLLRWWSLPFTLWMSWAALYLGAKRATQAELAGLASWFILACWAKAPAIIASHFLYIALARNGWSLPEHWVQWSHTVSWGIVYLWVFAFSFRLALRFIASRHLAAAFVALTMLFAVQNEFHWPLWRTTDEPDDDDRSFASLDLTQALFEKQQALWEKQTLALLPEREKTLDVYALIFAPYAREEVFQRESAMVADVLRRRFDADGRLLLLLNNPKTGETLPWATPENLGRGIDALARRMDRENDVLIVYMTSHGAKSASLSANNWPLNVPSVSAAMLREMLDASGVRNRIVIISACYAGSWIPALAGDSTLVMTASDSENTSYGCGNFSELTFFGRALFDEQLRRTHSLQAAFDQARIDIKQREQETGKQDYSNPQISVGVNIAPVLDALEKRLDGLDPGAESLGAAPNRIDAAPAGQTSGRHHGSS